ncbi:hypothetical protein VM1G_05898 [Cytospora mali]|uniref:Uncharacterized protein n=1 Tax=Cytospora mali TaxID=578113 RepID=A0A194W396_CYTMA|nr:hypothetical protein VM1G_05898 [Valsa mali]
MMSNAGPLTTTFTAPSSCATAAGLYQIWPASSAYYYEQGPLLARTDCYPSSYDASPSQYYSPGLCPNGYTAACSSTDVISTTVTETAYTCCPTAAHYTCADPANTLASSQSSFLGCTSLFAQALVLASVTAISDGNTDLLQTTTARAGEGLGANSIAVRFRSGDFDTTLVVEGSVASITAGASPTLASSSGTLAISVPTSTTSSSDGPASKGRHVGVSTTQAIGIAIGSAAAALIAVGLAVFFIWLRRRKQKIRAQIETPIPAPAPPPKDKKYRAPPPLSLSRSSKHSHSSSGVASVARSVNGKMIRGPFELHSNGNKEKVSYGVYHSHSQIGSPKSTDQLSSNAAAPSFWSPPPSYGFQPAELESPQRTLVESPQRSATSTASMYYYRGRAELASP